MLSSTVIYLFIFTIISSAVLSFLGARLGVKLALKNGNGKIKSDGLDKRLKVYQEAFSLSLQIPSAAEDPEKHAKVLHDCNKFWKNNCLYMAPPAREAFRIAYQTAWIFPTYKRQFQAGKIDEAEFRSNWNKIIACTREIVNAIGMNWPAELEPLVKESNYQRRSSDWQSKNLDRRRGKDKDRFPFRNRQN